ncbi:hypothetical protein KGQ27_00530 [Patescibacteria group bacterium]|nr:hypothetical protein [Patescibacteria group bacterium]MDE1946832.1 hypothetical protein [Patescibacteria group bacterium]MDE2010652.1 hypothetical protein [Patescibacteria group bacterium]MDE2232743.1 hypothetical protein [Patescibacteria group bacterium]
MKIISKQFAIVAAAILIASGVGAYAWRMEHRPHVLEIYAFSLASGRSYFIRTPNDKRILVDGGASSEVIRNITEILPFYSRRIDMIITTNSDSKNVGGLIDALGRYKVGEVIIPKFTAESLGLASSSDQIYSTFIDAVNESGALVKEVSAGDLVVFDGGNVGDITAGYDIDTGSDKDDQAIASILFPVSPDLFQYSKTSAPEIIMRLTYGKNSFFFLNDATVKIQKAVAFQGRALEKTNVLIVSTSALPANLADELTGVIRPDYLVYSKNTNARSSASAKNKTTDPLYYLLDSKRFNIKEKGIVRIISNGSEVSIE